MRSTARDVFSTAVTLIEFPVAMIAVEKKLWFNYRGGWMLDCTLATYFKKYFM